MTEEEIMDKLAEIAKRTTIDTSGLSPRVKKLVERAKRKKKVGGRFRTIDERKRFIEGL